MKVKGYSFSVIGSREMNQDSFLVNDEKRLYAVADGVGGGLGGEVASRMAVEGLNKYATPQSRLTDVFQKLQTEILAEAMSTYGDPVMGTTLSAVGVDDGQIRVCHVGDSRAYLFTQAHLRQLTEDQEHFDESVQSTVLASYLGIPTNFHPIKITEECVPVVAGDRLLLCSDGLYRQMIDSRIIAIIQSHKGNPEEIVKLLGTEAAQQEYSDNVTVVYVEIDP